MLKENINCILQEIQAVFNKLDTSQSNEIVRLICNAPHIYVAGVGRSGSIIRTFAMRLMHSGLNAFVIGEMVTPKAHAGDILFIGSGSGETGSLKAYADKARQIGMKIVVFTTDKDSYLGNLADIVVEVPAITPKSEKNQTRHTIQPMANLFEQSLLILLDALTIEVAKEKGLDYDSMFSRHANLE